MYKPFLENYSILITTVIFFYTIGFLVFKIFKITIASVYASIFSKLVLGLSVFVIATAIYFTHGKTVFLGTAISLFYFFSTRKYDKVQLVRFKIGSQTREWHALGYWLIGLTVLFIFRFYSISYNAESIPNIPNVDFAYYARISYFLVAQGFETTYPRLLYPELNTNDPYHYFDLWLNAGIAVISRGNHLLILYLVNYTLGIGLVWLGFCSLAETFAKPTAVVVCMALMCTFLMPIDLPYVGVINSFFSRLGLPTNSPPSYVSYGLWNVTKLYPVYIFILSSFICFARGYRRLGIVLLSLLSLMFTSIGLSILFAIFTYLIVDFFFGTRERMFFVSGIGYIGALFLFMVTFYMLAKNDLVEVVNLNPFWRFGTEPLYKSLLRPFKIFVDANVQLIILYLPFVVFFIFHFRHVPLKHLYYKLKRDSIFSISISLYGCSLVLWCLLNGLQDSNQFFADVGVTVANILLGFFFLTRRTYISVSVFMVVSSFLFLAIKNDIFEQMLYSQKYLTAIESDVKKAGPVYGFMFAGEDYNAMNYNPSVNILGDYIELFRSDVYPVCLSVFDSYTLSKADSANFQQQLRQSDFYRFVMQQKSSGSFHSIPKSRLDFIEHFGIKYLIVSPDVSLDSLLSSKVVNSYTDDYSKHVFVSLRTSDQVRSGFSE